MTNLPENLESLHRPHSPLSDPIAIKEGVIYSFTYDPQNANLPEGFGKWPDNNVMSSPAVPGQWVEKPDLATRSVVIKVNGGSHNRNVDTERASLLRANRLFQPSDKARPARIYGYGELPDGTRYVMLEHIPSDFITLDEYLGYDEEQHMLTPQSGRQIEVQEALEIMSGMAYIFSTMHAGGITQFEFNLSELFWNPNTKEVRMVDFEGGEFSRTRRVKGSHIQTDMNAVARTLYAALVGRRLNDFPWNETLDTKIQAFMQIHPQLQDICQVLVKGLCLEGRDSYPPSVQGSMQFYRDLLQLLQKYSP